MFYLNSEEKQLLKKHNESVEEFIDKELKGKIFHITSSKSLEEIISAKTIKAVADIDIFSQSKKCFARQNKWVSLFDFRNKSNEQLTDSIEKCLWSLLTRKLVKPVVLIVHKSCYPSLKFQEKHTKKDFDESCYIKNDDICKCKGTYVPYTECWYPDDMPYSQIEKIVETNFIKYPKSISDKLSRIYGNNS